MSIEGYLSSLVNVGKIRWQQRLKLFDRDREFAMNYMVDREPAQPQALDDRKIIQKEGVTGNERLTALVGVVLLVLIGVEIIITVNLRAFMPIHIIVGVILTAPLFLKMGSTGYRFLRYYTGKPAYVQKGAPRWQMRLLAPFLVLASLGLVGSGILLSLMGPTMALSVWVLRLHALCVICWIPLLALHLCGHIWGLPRLLTADWRRHAFRQVPDRWLRYGGTLAALLCGLGAALLFSPVTVTWTAWEPNLDAHIPGPLLAALFGAFVVTLGGLIIFKPWQWRE